MTEYPNPEMSMASFDVNKTMLESVDMEMTNVIERSDDILPEMDFHTEQSVEFKFDVSSLLEKMRSKPSDRYFGTCFTPI